MRKEEGIDLLHDPYPNYEKFLWKRDHFSDVIVSLPVMDNFEDYLGYYNTLGNGMCRSSTNDDLMKAYEKCRQAYCKELLAAHPDKNNGVDKGTQLINQKLVQIKKVH